ncbi:hypothetical protein L6452_44044 [Arctium lappa]|uniref:Uncharacterized protein n=1 Tax=Arctium lappa TaxID=4217 RepID=A0ACB8XEP7_ARCLA|nr:hypothetical protein L6452_44044 [Arctium lappa]
MAAGKSRGSKRPAGGSCSSTATVLLFIFVCIFGVWMLTSNSIIVSPQKKSIIMDSVFDNVHRKRNLPRKIPTHDHTVFEDNPGDLPADAVKSDGDFMAHDQEMDHNFSKQQDHEHDHHGITNNAFESLNGSDIDHRGFREKVRKKERKGKLKDTESYEGNTEPFKRHTEKMITAKKKDENDAKKQDKQITDANEGDDDQGHEKGRVKVTEIRSRSIANETKAQFENQEAKNETTTTSKKDEMRSFGIPNHESNDAKKKWLTQADQSTNHNSRSQPGGNDDGGSGSVTLTKDVGTSGYNKWELCNVTGGNDYIPCLDNVKAINELHGSRNHYEHRQRLCPNEAPTCLVPLPEGYKTPLPWPQSREKIWFSNVPHKGLVAVKGHQNWVKLTGEFLVFPGGGTQFVRGALHYIDFVQQTVPEIEWGKHTRVILDVGCGVASFGGYLFDKNVLTMSFAPKDEHEAQVQFALERGIPAISAVMGTQRLPFSSGVFDLVHCARCRVPWHREGGKLLLELNRVLRPGGYFVWSATPVYQKRKEDVEIWEAMSALTTAMCWELINIKQDKLNGIGVAVYQKPESNECYNERKKQEPHMCDDNPNAAWYVPLQTCMHKVATMERERGSQWPEDWPARIQTPPYWLNKTQIGIYDDFEQDYESWKSVVSNTYMNGLNISWSNVRNVMDMKAVYGGFAAALKDLKLWVMNVVNIDSPDTLPVIYERGLLGIYHDWCESFSTYPRTYDLLHADHLFSILKKRCKITPVIVEVDRIVRPGGKLIVRDESSMLEEIKNLLKSLHWKVYLTSLENQERILSAQKSRWRPKTYATRY